VLAVCSRFTRLCVCLQIVHGDLKSLNILLTRGWQLAKLGDVGVARYLKSKDVPDHVACESRAACLFSSIEGRIV
jgi:serine/threonine protein kinase